MNNQKIEKSKNKRSHVGIPDLCNRLEKLSVGVLVVMKVNDRGRKTSDTFEISSCG